jgi:hypothetical protein
MRNAKPLYVVIHGDQWVTDTGVPDHGLPVFGTETDAREYARAVADLKGEPVSAFKVAEYGFTGRLLGVK